MLGTIKLFATVFGAVLSALLVGIFVIRHLEKNDAELLDWNQRFASTAKSLREATDRVTAGDKDTVSLLKSSLMSAEDLASGEPTDASRTEIRFAIAQAKRAIQAAAEAAAAAKIEAAQLRAKAAECIAQAERIERSLKQAEVNGGALLMRPADSLRDDARLARAEAQALYFRADQLDPQN